MLRASCLKEDEIGRRKEGGRGKEEPSSSSYSILCTLTDVLVFFFNFSFLPFLHLRLLRALRGGDPTLMMMPRCGRRERGNNMRDTPLDPPPSSSQLCICTPGEKTEANLSQEAPFPSALLLIQSTQHRVCSSTTTYFRVHPAFGSSRCIKVPLWRDSVSSP